VATFTDPAVGKPQGGVVRDHRAPPCSRAVRVIYATGAGSARRVAGIGPAP
jgi:hypothetical protein